MMKSLARLSPLVLLAAGLGLLWLTGSPSPHRREARPRIPSRVEKSHGQVSALSVRPQEVALANEPARENPLGLDRLCSDPSAIPAESPAPALGASEVERGARRYARAVGERRSGADELGGILNAMSQEDAFLEFLTGPHGKLREPPARVGDTGFMTRLNP